MRHSIENKDEQSGAPKHDLRGFPDGCSGWFVLGDLKRSVAKKRWILAMSNTAEGRDTNSHFPLILIGLLLLAVVGFFVMWPMLWAYSWRDTTQRGILENSVDWPQPIQELATALTSNSPSSQPLEVYLLYGQRASTLSTVICRMPFTDEAWETIKSKLELQPVKPTFWAGLREQITSKSNLSWWPPTDHNADYFASARLLAGDEADLYICSVDRVADMIHIHYHFNF